MRRIRSSYQSNKRRFVMYSAATSGAVLGAGYLAYKALNSSSSEESLTRDKIRKDNVVLCDSTIQRGFNSGGNYAKHEYVPTHSIPCRDGTFVVPWATPTRESQINRLKNNKFDVLVVGGGCVGAGVALDAASRGLNVALVERDDYASGTSGRSTKLIHGGVRYLENAFLKLDYGQYLLVKEALHERGHMIWAAPYMARALPIMVPLEHWWELIYYRIGCFVYDFLAGDKLGVPNSMLFSKDQALFSFPMLNPSKVTGAIVYYDGQMNDTRYALAVVLTAMQSGATATNYTEVVRLTTDPQTGNIDGAIVRDIITREEYPIRAKAVVNCTGPFLDGARKLAHDATHPKPAESNQPTVDQLMKESEHKEKSFKEMVIPAAGVHVVLPDHFSPAHMGLIVPETADGRVLFFLPWEGGTLCGTTDSRSNLTMLPKPTMDEVDFILRESSRYLNKPIHRSDVRAAWSGLRPLVRDVHASGSTASISRDHVVEISDGKMISIGGGKWTTYRKMAQDAVDAVLKVHPSLAAKAGPCKTQQIMMIGADRAGIICDRSFDVITVTLREVYGYDRDIAEHLTASYGTRALQIAEIVKHGYVTRKPGLHPKRLVSKYPYLEAEIIFAVEQEMAQRAVDVLARRTRLAFIDHDAAVEALPQVISLMAQLLKWSKARCEEEKKVALEFLATMKMPIEN